MKDVTKLMIKSIFALQQTIVTTMASLGGKKWSYTSIIFPNLSKEESQKFMNFSGDFPNQLSKTIKEIQLDEIIMKCKGHKLDIVQIYI